MYQGRSKKKVFVSEPRTLHFPFAKGGGGQVSISPLLSDMSNFFRHAFFRTKERKRLFFWMIRSLFFPVLPHNNNTKKVTLFRTCPLKSGRTNIALAALRNLFGKGKMHNFFFQCGEIEKVFSLLLSPLPVTPHRFHHTHVRSY